MTSKGVRVQAMEALEDHSEDFTVLWNEMGTTGGLGAAEGKAWHLGGKDCRK